jgi:glycosyltransferase involved in cell wall biosynthesis
VRWIYRRSDLVLVQSLALLDPVRAMAGNTAVAYHPNPGERPLFHAPADADEEQTNVRPPPVWRASPGFNIVFAGNLGTVQALDTVLEAAQILGTEAGIRWVIVGSGTRSQWLQEQVRSRGLTQVELTGRFPPDQMPGIFAQADALLVSLVHAPAMSLTVPSKVQAYLAAGRPVLASLDGEGARVVQESGAGLVSAAEDAKGLASTALRLARMSDHERRAMGEAGRSYYEQHFAPDLLADALLQHFKVAGAAVAQAGKAPT